LRAEATQKAPAGRTNSGPLSPTQAQCHQAKGYQAQEPKGHGNPASRSRADAGPSQKAPQQSDSKAEASQRAPAGHTKSGPSSPGTKVPTTKKASGAGCLRSKGGSSSVPDTCVAQGNPSGDSSRDFSSAEVSFP
jgi:hypothetical protein